MIITCVMSAAFGASPLVGVDLPRAVALSKQGAQVRRALAEERASVQAEVNARRQALMAKREGMTRSDFESAVEAFNAAIDAQEAKLQQKQEELLAPVMSELEAQVDVLQGRGFRVLDSPREGLIGLPSACDATKAVAESKAGAFLAPAACRDRRVVRVDVGRALAGTAPAQKTTAALDQLKAERQQRLDEMRRELAKAPPSERASLKARMDERYAAYQREIQQAERSAEQTLRGRVVEAIRRTRPSSLTVVLSKSGAPCDATEAATAALAGRSFAEALEQLCPEGD